VERYVQGQWIVEAGLGFLLSVAFAAAMYYFIERHMATLRRRLQR